MENNVKIRDAKWDFIKGVLIIFVIWGHCCCYISDNSYEKNLLTTYIRLFQMPLFIFISGYFQKRICSWKHLIERMKKIVLHIGVPYATWTIVSYIVKSVMEFARGGTPHLNLIEMIKQCGFLWYLGCTCLCYGMFVMLTYIFKKYYLYALIFSVIILCILPIIVFHIQFMWPFYLLGYFFKSNDFNSIKCNSKMMWSIVVMGTLLVVIIGWLFPTKYTFYNISNQIYFFDFVKSIGFIAGRFSLYFGATLIALFWLGYLYDVIQNSIFSNTICVLGQKTLYLYASHVTILYYVLKPIVEKATHGKGILYDNCIVRYYIIASALTIVTVVILLLFERVLRKNRILRKMFCG